MSKAHASMKKSHYRPLVLMITLSFIAMYVLMFAMVDQFANVFASLNQFYMAGLMTAPMVIIEITVMGAMYQNKRANALIIAAGLVILGLFWIFIRQQAAISDTQFLRSMIPHHAGAVLMCTKAPIQDSEIKELCRTIISGQQTEIDQMKRKLGELEN